MALFFVVAKSFLIFISRFLYLSVPSFFFSLQESSAFSAGSAVGLIGLRRRDFGER